MDEQERITELLRQGAGSQSAAFLDLLDDDSFAAIIPPTCDAVVEMVQQLLGMDVPVNQIRHIVVGLGMAVVDAVCADC